MKLASFIVAVLHLLLGSNCLLAAEAAKPPVGVPSDAVKFRNKWYRVYLEPGGWQRAKERCVVYGGQLTMTPDSPTWNFVRTLIPGKVTVWLGGTDDETEGLWKWLDGAQFTFTAWKRKQPDNYRKSEHYLQASRDAWNDLPKDYKIQGFVCEWRDR